MRVHLRSDFLLGGKIYEAGLHDLPDAIATQLEKRQKELSAPRQINSAGVLVKANGGAAPVAPVAAVEAAKPVTLAEDCEQREQAVHEHKAAEEEKDSKPNHPDKPESATSKHEVKPDAAPKPEAHSRSRSRATHK